MSEVSDMIRKVFKEGDDKRDAGLTTPEGIRRFDDIVYGNDDACQVLDVYRPKEAEGDLPVIVSVHGGAGCTEIRSVTSITAWIWPCGDLRW